MRQQTRRAALLAVLAVVMVAAGPCASAPPPANVSPGQAAWLKWQPRLDLAAKTRVTYTEYAAGKHVRHEWSDEQWKDFEDVGDAAKRAIDVATLSLWAFTGNPSDAAPPIEVDLAEAAVRGLMKRLAEIDVRSGRATP